MRVTNENEKIRIPKFKIIVTLSGHCREGLKQWCGQCLFQVESYISSFTHKIMNQNDNKMNTHVSIYKYVPE